MRMLGATALVVAGLLMAGSATASQEIVGFFGKNQSADIIVDVPQGSRYITFHTPVDISYEYVTIEYDWNWREFADVGSYERGFEDFWSPAVEHIDYTNHGFSGTFDIPSDSISHSCCVTSYLDGEYIQSGFTDYYYSTLKQARIGLQFEGEEGQPYFISFAAVPEPAAWALMLGGFGAAGVVLRRGRKLRTA